MPTKTCQGKCGLTKDLECFYVSNKKSGSRMPICKVCFGEKSKERYYANLEAARAKSRAAALRYYYANQEALQKKRRQAYHEDVDASRKKNHEYDARRKDKKKAYRQSNAERIQQRNAEYRDKNRAAIREQSRAYYLRNREMLKQRQQQWRIDHPEAYREVHRRWKRANKAKVNAATHRRRYRMSANGGTYTVQEWLALKDLCGNRCLMCGKHESEFSEALHWEHIVPVEKGGSNAISNGQPLCRSCNSKKGQQIMDLRPSWILAILDNGLLLAPPEEILGKTQPLPAVQLSVSPEPIEPESQSP